MKRNYYKGQMVTLDWRMRMSFSEEQAEIIETLKKNRINSLWHFTDIRNLPYIRKLDGLRSKENLEGNRYWGRNILFPGGDDISHNLDRDLGNWDKIHLNFRPNTPMAYNKKREKHLVFIEIKPEVAACEDVYFTDCNATKREHKRGEGIEGLTYVNFDIIHRPYERNPDWHKYVQAEVLVPHHVPISMFKAIHFISNASKEYGESLWGRKCNLFCVNPETFYDTSIYRKGEIQFPHIREVFISTKRISKEKVHAIRSNALYLVPGEPFWVIVHTYAITGTRVSISVYDIRNRKIEGAYGEAKRDIDGIFCHQFTAPKGLRGLEVKVYIDTILWTHHKMRCMEMK